MLRDNLAVPLFADQPSADTIVALVTEHPLSYAPVVAMELQLLRANGLDVQVLALGAGAKRPSATQGRTSLQGLSAARRMIRLGSTMLVGNLRASSRYHLGYLHGLRDLVTCVTAPRQSICVRMHWILHFLRAMAWGERLHRCGVRRCHAHFTTNIAVFIASAFPIEVSMTLHGPRDFAGVPREIIRRKVEVSSLVRVVSRDGLSRVLATIDSSLSQRVVLIPLGVDTQRFAAHTARSDVSALRVVCVARLEPVKGHSVLLDAFARLSNEGRSVELLLVGDGSRRRLIERHIRKLGLEQRVRCVGNVQHEHLPTLLESADVFALASQAEGLPVALMEAMASGLPCVATRVNGVPEILLHLETGLLVPSSDPEALAAALQELIEKPSLRQSLGEGARRHVVEHYNVAQNATRLAQVLSRPHELVQVSALRRPLPKATGLLRARSRRNQPAARA